MPTDPQPLTDVDDLLNHAAALLNDHSLQGLTRARDALEKVRAARSLLADYTPPQYEPEHARPEPVATEREWLDKVRGLLTAEPTGWYTKALQALDDAAADLTGRPVTVGARRALQSIRDMTLDHAEQGAGDIGGLSARAAQRIFEAARDGLASIDDAAVEAADDQEAARTGGTFTGRYLTPEPVDQPDPTIEVLPLPGDRFLLVLSNWPPDSPILDWTGEAGADWRELTGAAAVYVATHPVYLPDGLRTNA